MPKIRWPLRQPNKHATACCMLHAPCPIPLAAHAHDAKCDQRTCLSASLSLSLSLFRTSCASKKTKFPKICNWVAATTSTTTTTLTSTAAASSRLGSSSNNKNVYAFFVVTDRTQGFSYSAAASSSTPSTATLRKLHAHKNWRICQATAHSVATTVGQAKRNLCAPKTTHSAKKKKECCQSDGRDAGRECCQSRRRLQTCCKAAASPPMPAWLPSIWMTMCMGMQLCVCVCAVGNEDDII